MTIDDPAWTAQCAVTSAVRSIVRQVHGDAAFTERPIWPGAHSTDLVPEPLAALNAALLVQNAARHEVHRQALAARAGGMSWRDLAEPLGVEHAEAAYGSLLPTPLMPFDQPNLHWHCGTCGGYVTDHGPYGGHPDDCEDGHVETCERHAREVAEYRRMLGDED